jgi:hypothetical protein
LKDESEIATVDGGKMAATMELDFKLAEKV